MIKSISKSKSNNNTNQKIINKYNEVKQVYKSPIISKPVIIITFLSTTIIIIFYLQLTIYDQYLSQKMSFSIL